MSRQDLTTSSTGNSFANPNAKLLNETGITKASLNPPVSKYVGVKKTRGREEFTNCFSNRKPLSSEYRIPLGDTQSSAQTTDGGVSDAKVENKS